MYILVILDDNGDCIVVIDIYWLVVELSTPLKNMSSSIGMMAFQVYGKIKNVPNHQPVM